MCIQTDSYDLRKRHFNCFIHLYMQFVLFTIQYQVISELNPLIIMFCLFNKQSAKLICNFFQMVYKILPYQDTPQRDIFSLNIPFSSTRFNSSKLISQCRTSICKKPSFILWSDSITSTNAKEF